LLFVVLVAPITARADVIIGAVYPTTGAGADARHAIETALEIVNGTHEQIPVLMGHGGGLDRLGGAKLSVVYADDPGDPAQAAAAAEHLVTDDHAQALIGGMSDATAAAISHVAEQHSIPFLSLDSTLTNTESLSWFFRLGRTPATDNIGVLKLLGAMASANGHSLDSVAVVFEDSPAGRDRAAPLRKAVDAAHLKLIDTPVAPDPVALDAVAQTLATAAPSAVLFEFGGPHEPTLLALLAARGIGPLVLMQRGDSSTTDGAFRSVSYTADPLPARPGVSEVDAAYKARAGKPLDTPTAREITGVLLLADVFNRAASTKPIDLRTALMATDTPGGETLMLWDGIRFDDTGQNVLASPALQQMQHGAFQTVAPEPVATASAVWPEPK
jgi:branched-chain amino acid transport system substrate-binding protein